VGRIIRQLKVELFRLIRVPSRGGFDKNRFMATVLPADPNLPKKLLDRVCNVMRLKHYSLRTERTYCDWIERFIRFHELRHHRDMGEAEVSAFLTYLARDGKVAASTQNQHVKASLTCREQV
jgi:integrase-like protein